MKAIVYNVYNYLLERLKYQGEANFSGGENRKYSGETVESCISLIADMFRNFYPTLNIEVRAILIKLRFLVKMESLLPKNLLISIFI